VCAEKFSLQVDEKVNGISDEIIDSFVDLYRVSRAGQERNSSNLWENLSISLRTSYYAVNKIKCPE